MIPPCPDVPPPSLRRTGSVLAALLLIVSGSPAGAFDPPDLVEKIFDADGIFLAADERSSVLEALAAIASNFPDHPRIDDDLREKALALALRLDPLHFHSRLALRELALAAEPKPTPYFDNVSSVSETLWTIGQRLAEPPLDPEELRLAPYLLELSLLTHPAPPEDRLADFARVCGRDAPEWKPAVGNQRGTNASTARARDLYAEGRQLLRARRTAVATTPPPAPPAPGPDSPPGISRPLRTPPPPVETVSASLATVRQVVAFESGPMAGTVTLTLREPRSGIERGRLAERAALGDSFPLVPSDESIPLEDLVVPSGAASGRSWTWPEGAIGEVRFEPSTALSAPRRQFRTSALLPALVLIESALANKPANASFVLRGEIDPETLQASVPGDLVSALEAAQTLDRPYFLVPSGTLELLIADLQRSHRLDLLFKYELISYQDLSGAIARLTAPTDPALLAASADFDKIEAASANLPLSDLARLPSAQDRLRALLATCPDHLSAKAMLEYGLLPMTPQMRAAQYATKLETVVGPFLALESSSEDLFGLAGTVANAKSQFLRLRPEAPTEARDLLGSAEDLIDAAELYLQLTNKGTSIAEQRLRETREAIAAYRTERSRLGLE